MKTLFLIMGLTSCVCFFSKAQYVTIPDTAFVNWMNANGLAGCLNGNQLDTTCPQEVFPVFDAVASEITDLTGITYFILLEGLQCALGGNLAYLPALPKGLKSLTCMGNVLTALPQLPSGLNYIDCSGNQILVLPSLPDSLTYLDCSNNPPTMLPILPTS